MTVKTDNRSTEEKIRELTDLTREKMEKYHVPGVAIGLQIGDEQHVICLGVTSIENPLPVTDTTIFQIGSTGKTFTSTVLMCLVEQGKLDLDDKVRKYLPEFKVKDEEASANATIRSLLNHTAGWIGDHFVHTGHGEDSGAKYIASMANLEQVSPLGFAVSYNNASFMAAGRLIEVITGKMYENVVREMVLEPLEMTNSFYSMMDVMVHRFTVGHAQVKDKTVVATPWGFDRCVAPAGGLCSDVRDQFKYARFHMGDGTNGKGVRLLSPESLKVMQTPTHPGGVFGQVALNWFVKDIDGVRIIFHGGTTNGQKSEFWMVPAQKFSLTSTTNSSQGGHLNSEINDWVREHFLGIVEPKPVGKPMAADRLSEYAGSFVQGGEGAIFKFDVLDSGLLMSLVAPEGSPISDVPEEAFPPVKVHCYGTDKFFIIEGDMKDTIIDFMRDPSGKISWARLGGRMMAHK